MIRKRILAVFVSAVMVLTVNVGSASANTDKFTDINGHWGQAIINEAASLGVVGGYPEGYYLPDNLMKREEFYKLMTNVLTVVPNTTNTVLSFKDVDPIEWYVPTIKTAVAAGITSGYQDGTFGIGQMISRQEAAKVVASVILMNNLDTSKNASSAKDAASIGEWALPYVNIMFQKGYMQGDTEGNFRPTTALTRAEAATLLLNVKKMEKVIAGPNGGNAVGTTPTTTGTAITGAAVTGTSACKHDISKGAFTLGTGTSSDPYQVSTEAQLNHIREHVSEGLYYILTKDITVKTDFAAAAITSASSGMTTSSTADGNDWGPGNFVPIGSQEKPFKGSFDGKGHTISGMVIAGTLKGSDTGADYSGLFGYVDTSSSIDSVTMAEAKIKGNRYTGGIAGYNAGSITNCVLAADSTVTGESYTGGITGYTEKVLKSNANRATVKGTSANTGGIVGYAKVDGNAIVDCVNKGSVSGENGKTGGIVGYLVGNDNAVTIENCENTGAVAGANHNAGGIVGIADGENYIVDITDCYNSGEIRGEGVNGGIVGYAQGSKVKISECNNTGEINGGSSGGIVGNNQGNVEYCYNTGKVMGTNAAGGVVGYQTEGTGKVTKCYNDGAVTSNNNAGGIVGQNEDKVNNCYNTGKIKGTNAVGGIVGKNLGVLLAVYNAGEVTASNGEGALIGRNVGKLTNSFWLEETCDSDVGLSDSSATRRDVTKVTKEELSGQIKIKGSSGYQLITDVLDDMADAEIWEFTYKIKTEASRSNSDTTGNTISSSDLDDAYIYPGIRNLERK